MVLASMSFNLLAYAEPPTREHAEEMIEYTAQPLALKSKLKKRYNAYTVNLKSTYPGTLKIESTSLLNGTDSNAAYESVYYSPWHSLWFCLLGLAGLAVALPMQWTIQAKNHNARKESEKYPSQMQATVIKQNETLAIKALVPLGQRPLLRVSFKDPESGLKFATESH